MGRIQILLLKDPNRGFLREHHCLDALSSNVTTTIEQLRASTLAEHALRWLTWERDICAADAAVYVFSKRVVDRIARLGRRHPRMTVGLTTALWLTDMLSQRPAIDHWVISHARWRPIWLPPQAQVHLSRHARDDAWPRLIDGIEISVSPPLRAVLDCIRFRELLGREAVLTALRAALEHDLDPNTLRAHARIERLEKPLLSLLADVTRREPCPPASPSSPPPAPPSPAPSRAS